MTEQELKNAIATKIRIADIQGMGWQTTANSILNLIKADGWMKPQNHPQKSDAVNDYHEELTGERW